jgi:hypothetical protein
MQPHGMPCGYSKLLLPSHSVGRWPYVGAAFPHPTYGQFDICTGLWHISLKIAKATMETSRRAPVVQRVRKRCEPGAKAPPKILPEPPTEMTAEAQPE